MCANINGQFRQFVDISRLYFLTHRTFTSVETVLNRVRPSGSLSDIADASAMTALFDSIVATDRRGFEAVVSAILQGMDALTPVKPRHPHWLTQLSSPSGKTFEEELAIIGVQATDSWWVELWHTADDVKKAIASKSTELVVPTSLDGLNPFWHTSDVINLTTKFLPGRPSPSQPMTGFGVDLREAGGDDIEPVQELIIAGGSLKWETAWRGSGFRLHRGDSAKWATMCGITDIKDDWKTIDTRRKRHRRRLLRMYA